MNLDLGQFWDSLLSGGLILNLMPCVFPVIGLKVMSFVKQAGEDPGQIKKHGLVFTAGVILSFWLLVSILLILRDSLAEDLGWGFSVAGTNFCLRPGHLC